MTGFVENPLAVVFSSGKQLLEGVTSFPKQVNDARSQHLAYQGHITFLPRINRNTLPIGVTYNYNELDNFWETGFYNPIDKRKLSETMPFGGRPAVVTAWLSFRLDVVDKFREYLLPILQAAGYKPDYAHFSGIWASDSDSEFDVTLLHKGGVKFEELGRYNFIPDAVVSTLSIGRAGHPERWLDRLLDRFPEKFRPAQKIA